MMFITFIFGLFVLWSLFLLFLTVSSFIGFARTKVPQIPTAARDIKVLVEKGLLSKDDVLMDLGCNNGKVLFMSEKLVGCKGVGYELALWGCIYAWVKVFLKCSKVKVVWGNFFDADLSQATVVYCYLYPFLMPSVGEKIKNSCRPGTIVIVRDFPIKSLSQIDHFTTYGVHEFFIYKV